MKEYILDIESAIGTIAFNDLEECLVEVLETHLRKWCPTGDMAKDCRNYREFLYDMGQVLQNIFLQQLKANETEVYRTMFYARE
jgi:hypothetical protein